MIKSKQGTKYNIFSYLKFKIPIVFMKLYITFIIILFNSLLIMYQYIKQMKLIY